MVVITNTCKKESEFPDHVVAAWKHRLAAAKPLVLAETVDVPLDKQEDFGWHFYKEQDGVKIYKKKEHKNIIAKGICVVETNKTPLEFLDYVDFCHNDPTLEKIVAKSVRACTLLANLTTDEKIMHLEVETPGPKALVKDRDFLIGSMTDTEPNRHNASLAPSAIRYGCSVDFPGMEKPAKGYARGEIFVNGWFVEAMEEPGKLLCQHIMSQTIGGWIPQALVENSLVEAPLSMCKYKRLAEEACHRLNQTQGNPGQHD